MDARRMNHETLPELRKRAVASVQKARAPRWWPRLFRWAVRLCMAGLLAIGWGWGNLDARKRGGRRPKLDAKAMKWVYDTVTMNPSRWSSPLRCGRLRWSEGPSSTGSDKAQQGIGVPRSCSTGSDPQRPVWRAYQQQPDAVKRWLDEEYPRLRDLAGRCRRWSSSETRRA